MIVMHTVPNPPHPRVHCPIHASQGGLRATLYLLACIHKSAQSFPVEYIHFVHERQKLNKMRIVSKSSIYNPVRCRCTGNMLQQSKTAAEHAERSWSWVELATLLWHHMFLPALCTCGGPHPIIIPDRKHRQPG